MIIAFVTGIAWAYLFVMFLALVYQAIFMPEEMEFRVGARTLAIAAASWLCVYYMH